ncbi:MAG TPA: hypothetical protein VFV08_02310 [Puia sp.]|nr:hypothetical protein [Puia sp.]
MPIICPSSDFLILNSSISTPSCRYSGVTIMDKFAAALGMEREKMKELECGRHKKAHLSQGSGRLCTPFQETDVHSSEKRKAIGRKYKFPWTILHPLEV